jgi:hypothetical protein
MFIKLCLQLFDAPVNTVNFLCYHVPVVRHNVPLACLVAKAQRLWARRSCFRGDLNPQGSH